MCSLIISSYSVSPLIYFGFFSKLYGRSNGLPELLKNLYREKHLIGFVMSNWLGNLKRIERKSRINVSSRTNRSENTLRKNENTCNETTFILNGVLTFTHFLKWQTINR